MIRNVIFDIGNVLTDFRWKEFLQDKGFSEEMIDRIAEASVLNPVWNELDRGEWSDEQIMEAFIAADPEIEEELRLAFGNVKGMVTPRDYAIPWVKRLKQSGYGVYYLSNFSRKAEEDCKDALTFIPFTDGGILSYRDKLIKPDPRIYELLLDRFGLKAEECVFIDDTMRNIEACEACGIKGICFQSYEQVRDDLRKLGVEW